MIDKKKIFIILAFTIFLGSFVLTDNVNAATTNCECATGSTGTLVWHTTQNTSSATSDIQCNANCSNSGIIPPTGEVIYYKYNGGAWIVATSQTCQSKYGSDYVCVSSNNILPGGTCGGNCPNNPSDSSWQCCTSGSVNMVGGNSSQQCASGYICGDPQYVSAANLSLATTSCTSQTTANGKCFPNSVFAGGTSGVGGSGQISGSTIPGTTTDNSGIISCGRPGQSMCTLCDLIAGLNTIIQYVMKISIGVGMLAVTIAGIMYIVSGGDTNMTGKAKTTMKNAAVGFVIIFAGWVIINTTISTIGAIKDPATGNSTFGMHITSWGQFECAAKAR